MDCTTQKELIELGKIILPALITLIAVISGSYLGHKFAKQQARSTKALDFLERRIREFYSPMMGCIKRVRALSELRMEISRAADIAWKKICKNAPTPFLNSDEAFKPFESIIDYENNQLYIEILPAYDQMISIFTDNYWLTDDDTRKYYVELCRFVEIWHRYKADTIPREVIKEIEHSEERLQRLYETIEQRLKEYTQILADKKST